MGVSDRARQKYKGREQDFLDGGKEMKRRTQGIEWLVVLCLFVGGCGGAASTTPTTVTLSLTSATVAIGSTITLTASVATTNSNTAVNWEVNSIIGGNATVGTIDASGDYTAPTSVPIPNIVTVTAVSQADTTATASASITIDSGIRATVAPLAVAMGTSETFVFTATVTGTLLSTSQVTWSVCQASSVSTTTAATTPCPADTTGTQGSFIATSFNATNGTSTGTYQAPVGVPSVSPIVIQAATVADPNQFATSSITLSAATDPTVTSIYPTDVAQGSLFIDVYIQGANFLNTSVVQVTSSNGSATLTPTAAEADTLRAQIPASIFTAAPTNVQIQVSRQGGSLISCTVPSLCQMEVDAVRPAIVAAAPNSLPQQTTNGAPQSFNIDGGYFGTNAVAQTPAAIQAEFDGAVASGTSILPRKVTVSLTGSSNCSSSCTGDLSTPGLHQVSLLNPSVTTPAAAPQNVAVTNFSVQSSAAAVATATAMPTLSSLAVGTAPSSIAINTATGHAVIANFGSNSLTVVDMTANPPAVISTIPLGSGAGPTGVAVDNVRNFAVVANNTAKTISVVNLATSTVTTVSTQIPAAPYSVGVNPITGIALVAYQSTNIGALVDLTQTPPAFIGAVTLGTGTKPQVGIIPNLNWGFVTPGGAGTFSIVNLAQNNSSLIGAGGAVRVSSTSTTTITTETPVTLLVGDAVLITGVTDTSFNGIFTVVTVPTSNSFTFTQAGADSTSSGGSISYSDPLATVAFGQNVTGIAVNQEAKQALLTDSTSQSSVIFMSVLDQAVTPLALEAGANAIAVNPYTDVAVSINAATGTGSVLDPRTPLRLATFALPGTNPVAVAIDPGTNQAVVVNSGSNDISIFSLGAIKSLELEQIVLPINRQLGTDLTLTSATPLTMTLIGKGFVTAGPVVARLDGFVVNPVPGSVTDRQMTVIVPPSLLNAPRRFAVDVMNSSSPGTVSNVEGLSVVQPVDLTGTACPSPTPSAVAIDDVLNLALVTETSCDSVAIVNLATGTVTATVAVGAAPQGIATMPGEGLAVVANSGDNTVTILSTADPTQSTTVLDVGVQPIGVAIDPLTGTTLVTNANANSDSVSSFTVTDLANATVSSTNVGGGPVAVGIDTYDQLALVANASTSTLTLLDISQSPPLATASLSGPNQPTSVAWDPVTKDFIVTASLGNAVFFVNPINQLLSSDAGGINPTSVAYNYLSSTIVTANSASSTLSVMDIADGTIKANIALKSSQLGAIAIHPKTNLALLVDQANNRLLLVPLPQ
jgi:DNA-binding beta-propeller fold protein YncE